MTVAATESQARPGVRTPEAGGERDTPASQGRTFIPQVDVLEMDDRFELRAEIPGSSQVGVTLEDGVLVLGGRVEPRLSEKAHPLCLEYGVGDFHRTFRVGGAVDAEKIRARYHDGVLVVVLPKREALQPRKIQVCAG